MHGCREVLGIGTVTACPAACSGNDPVDDLEVRFEEISWLHRLLAVVVFENPTRIRGRFTPMEKKSVCQSNADVAANRLRGTKKGKTDDHW
jgi:hypothetical protein